MYINLYVSGTCGDICRVLDDISADLRRDFDARVWRDYRISEKLLNEHWEGPATVEIHSHLIAHKVEAIPLVGGAVERADPKFEIVIGGDIFLRPDGD